MQEQHGIAGALVDVVHPEPVLLEIVRCERVSGEISEALVGGAV